MVKCMQGSLNFEQDSIEKAVGDWEYSNKDKGEVYTKPEVIEYMLTICGLNSLDVLLNSKILEPSCGDGEFVLAIAKRLLSFAEDKIPVAQLIGRIKALDIVSKSIEKAKYRTIHLLEEHGYTCKESRDVADSWFIRSDFLLTEISEKFTHIIGNPPYVRVENIPKDLLGLYRSRFSTMTDRADLYIPFFEKSLEHLDREGRLIFICTDRWIKNTYGRGLRHLISNRYSFDFYADLYGVEAFAKKVSTYPAITQISNGGLRETILMHSPVFSEAEAQEVCKKINGELSSISAVKGVAESDKPWLTGSADQTFLVKKIEAKYPTLEDTGCRVYIGTATGANSVFIIGNNDAEIELSRLVPVITARELAKPEPKKNHKYIINTYDESGIIDIDKYPNLKKYLEGYRDILSNRHIARKDSKHWYKTIDKIPMDRVSKEKLLIPDIRSESKVYYSAGGVQPNNSIYYICSEEWNLHALRVVLLSRVANLFIANYATRVANGYFRYQAQHLRKICLPLWSMVPDDLKERLVEVGRAEKSEEYTALAAKLYGLDDTDKEIIGI